jgi:hypothetical protein
VDRVKVHVRDCVVFGVLVVVERLSVSFRSSEDVLPEYFPKRESMVRAKLFPGRAASLHM